MQQTSALLNGNDINETLKMESRLEPEDSSIEDMLLKRKTEIEENDITDRRDPDKISHLTELKNIQDILELIYDVAKEQRKVIEKYRNETTPTPPQS